MLRDLMDAAPGLALIGLAVAGVALGGRDPRADEHDVSDYRPELAPVRRAWPLLDVDEPAALERQEQPVLVEPAPVAWQPPVAELVVALVVRRYGDSPADIAGRWLRQLGDEARAGLAVAR